MDSRLTLDNSIYQSIRRELKVKLGDIIVFQKNDKGEIVLQKGKLKIEVE